MTSAATHIAPRSTTDGPARPGPLPVWLQAQCRQLLAQRGHAWLLHGPPGLGQFELGMALVRAWLCDQPTDEGIACGQCASCHGIDVHTHADLCVLMPEVDMLAHGWPLDEKARSDIEDKKRKPSQDIRVDAMRAVIQFCQRTSARGRARAVLIHPAQRMNAVTANALLKTLEEPPGDVRFVLCTGAVHQMLPTIRSRCLGHAMHWPTQEQALHWLCAHGVDAADAPHWLRLAGSQVQDALELARAAQSLQTAAAGRKPAAAASADASARTLAQWRQMPRQLAQGDTAALAGLPPPQAVQWLQKICHDLMCQAQGAAPRYFDAADLPDTTPALAVLGRWAQSLSGQARTAAHPFNAALMLQALTAQARAVLRARRQGS